MNPDQLQRQSTAAPDYSNPVYHQSQYVIRKKFFTLFGARFHIYDLHGNLAFYSKQKAFKLKEDIRIFGDEAMTSELITITARNIIDFSATYDVVDSPTGVKIGALKRKGLKSAFVRDEWQILDVHDQEVGLIQEESGELAFVRRFLIGGWLGQLIAPQGFHGKLGSAPVFHFQQNRNPLVRKIELDYRMDSGQILDRRLGIAAAALLSAIEGRQG